MTKHRLTRKPGRLFDDGKPRYWHPNGWVIKQAERDWDLRGLTRDAHHQWSPKRWWEVRPFATRTRRVHTFDTLREARKWCDEHRGRA